MVRFKNRYLIVEVGFEEEEQYPNIAPYSLTKAIRESLQQLAGTSGVSLTSTLTTKYYSDHTCKAIIRVPKDNYKLVWSAIFFIDELQKKRCRMNVVHTSGTIKQSQKWLVERNKQDITRLGQARIRKMEIDLMDVKE